MSNRTDWKFLTGLLVALASLIVPVLIWHTDQATRALKLEVIATAALTPPPSIAITGLKLNFNGEELFEPYLTVIEVSNTGTRPLLANEFESPIEIGIQKSAKAIGVEVTSSSPADLSPSVKLENGKVVITPLLLNPNDQIRVALLTAGGRPEITARSRIVGIVKVDLAHQPVAEKLIRKVWLEALIAFVLTVAYMAGTARFFDDLVAKKFRLAAGVLTLACGFGGVFIGKILNGAYPVPDLYLFLVLVLAALVATPFMKRPIS